MLHLYWTYILGKTTSVTPSPLSYMLLIVELINLYGVWNWIWYVFVTKYIFLILWNQLYDRIEDNLTIIFHVCIKQI